jgi:hypothetical protein
MVYCRKSLVPNLDTSPHRSAAWAWRLNFFFVLPFADGRAHKILSKPLRLQSLSGSCLEYCAP